MYWYVKVLKQYADFEGRARRKEYWIFALFNVIFGVTAIVLDTLLEISFTESGYGPIYLLYMLAMLIPGLAVGVRRLHDVGKSGAMILVGLIPFVGGIWLLVLFLRDSEAGENQYGPNPKEEQEEYFDTLRE
ncbi:MAG TPA: DUF805 domain-containing protein [Bacteroidales bacterium]|nr:DUF805 domain-containing protein [Bacteroidales bacterium]HRZ49447.1 DUF805 domain-containing protein [Bacteroidales bacterium]